MENLAYSRKSQPAEWYHVEDCFDENILSRVIQHFPDSKDIPITGKREGANNFRKFASRLHTPVLADMFKEFDGTSAREKFTDITGVDCTHGALRVELCQDSPGFYLEPHIDIPEKLIKALSIENIALILKHINRVKDTAENKLSKIIKIEGKEYGFHPELDDLLLGEYIDLDNFIGDWDNMEKAMNVLYRPIIVRLKDK